MAPPTQPTNPNRGPPDVLCPPISALPSAQLPSLGAPAAGSPSYRTYPPHNTAWAPPSCYSSLPPGLHTPQSPLSSHSPHRLPHSDSAQLHGSPLDRELPLLSPLSVLPPGVMDPDGGETPPPSLAEGIFRDFSFEASQGRLCHPRTDENQDTPYPASSPVPSHANLPSLGSGHRVSVTELSYKLSEQHIQPDNFLHDSSCYHITSTSSCEPIEVDPPSPKSPALPFDQCESATNATERSPRPSVRQQRQISVRLQCTSSHKRELSSLVRRMVEDEDQCVVRSSEEVKGPGDSAKFRQLPVELEQDSDENRWPDEGPLRDILKYRRSGELVARSASACVNKVVRMRRKPKRIVRS